MGAVGRGEDLILGPSARGAGRLRVPGVRSSANEAWEGRGAMARVLLEGRGGGIRGAGSRVSGIGAIGGRRSGRSGRKSRRLLDWPATRGRAHRRGAAEWGCFRQVPGGNVEVAALQGWVRWGGLRSRPGGGNGRSCSSSQKRRKAGHLPPARAYPETSPPGGRGGGRWTGRCASWAGGSVDCRIRTSSWPPRRISSRTWRCLS